MEEEEEGEGKRLAVKRRIERNRVIARIYSLINQEEEEKREEEDEEEEVEEKG